MLWKMRYVTFVGLTIGIIVIFVVVSNQSPNQGSLLPTLISSPSLPPTSQPTASIPILNAASTPLSRITSTSFVSAVGQATPTPFEASLQTPNTSLVAGVTPPIPSVEPINVSLPENPIPNQIIMPTSTSVQSKIHERRTFPAVGIEVDIPDGWLVNEYQNVGFGFSFYTPNISLQEPDFVLTGAYIVLQISDEVENPRSLTPPEISSVATSVIVGGLEGVGYELVNSFDTVEKNVDIYGDKKLFRFTMQYAHGDPEARKYETAFDTILRSLTFVQREGSLPIYNIPISMQNLAFTALSFPFEAGQQWKIASGGGYNNGARHGGNNFGYALYALDFQRYDGAVDGVMALSPTSGSLDHPHTGYDSQGQSYAHCIDISIAEVDATNNLWLEVCHLNFESYQKQGSKIIKGEVLGTFALDGCGGACTTRHIHLAAFIGKKGNPWTSPETRQALPFSSTEYGNLALDGQDFSPDGSKNQYRNKSGLYSSLTPICLPETAPTNSQDVCGGGMGVTIYENPNFGGKSLVLLSNDDDLCNNPLNPNTDPLTFVCFSAPSWNDIASSIRVAPGWHAILYLHSKAQEQELGEYHIVRNCNSDITDFGDPSWNFSNGASLNDNVSRIVVERCSSSNTQSLLFDTAASASTPCNVDFDNLVTNLNNTGPGSLRQIIADTNEGDTVYFGVTGTIKLADYSSIYIDKNLTIIGPGASSLTIRGSSTARVIIATGVTVTLNGLGIAGGGIENNGILLLTDSMVFESSSSGILNTGNLSITESTISDNSTICSSCPGGGIYNTASGIASLTNSTISDNRALGGGGAIFNGGGILRLSNVTISNNASVGATGGIWSSGGTVTIKNSIIADYTACTLTDGATLVAQDTNLALDGSCPGFTLNNMNPLLDRLRDYGGQTWTMRLAGLPNKSPALDTASDCTDLNGKVLTTDQRGRPRPVDGDGSGGARCDIGAFEFAPTDATPQTFTVTNLNESGPGSLRQAIADAYHNDTINIALSGTIMLDTAYSYGGSTTGGRLYIDKNLTINGPGAALLKVEAGDRCGVAICVGEPAFSIRQGVTVKLNSLSITKAATSSGWGIQNEGTLTLTNISVFGSSGNGIINSGNLTVFNSTINDNTVTCSSCAGGGISNNGGTVNLVNSTLVNNSGANASGIYNSDGTLQLSNVTLSNTGIWSNGGSVIVKNSVIDNYNDCYLTEGASLVVQGVNLSRGNACPGFTFTNTNPLLDRLRDYGGQTWTMRLAGLPNKSPALDTASDCTDLNGKVLTTDQRGRPRPVDGDGSGGARCDIGAFEFAPTDATPQTFTVNSLNDNGLGSLRQAIADASHNDAIRFGITGTITLADYSSIYIDKNLTVVGPGTAGLTIRGGYSTRVFIIAPGVNVTIDGLGIAGTVSNTPSGGIQNDGTLVLTNSMVFDSSSSGIINTGNITITSSAIYNNSVTCSVCSGVGIYNDGGSVTLTNTTLSGNLGVNASAIYNSYGTLRLSNVTLSDSGIWSNGGSVLAKNSIINSYTGCSLTDGAVLTALGVNLSLGDDCPGFTLKNANPLLGVLQDNGGITFTLALEAASPALDAVIDCSDSTSKPIITDQRGRPRPVDGDGNGQARCDIGAFEAPVDFGISLNAAPKRNYYTTNTVLLSWGHISWATEYELQVDTDDTFANPIYFVSIVPSNILSVWTPAFPEGPYYWRVRARQPSGNWGMWSMTDTFTIDVP